MSTPIVPFTVQDIMDQVYVNVDDDPTSSLTQDDEFTSRLRLINMGIGAWERQDVYWRELWKLYTHASGLTTATTYTIAATDFLMPGSLLYLTNPTNSTNVEFIDMIDPTQAIKYVQQQGKRGAFITGNAATGWTLNLTWTPQTSDTDYGFIPSFYYYKSAARVAVTTDVPEMSDPTYLVWYVTYQKQLFNNRTDMAQDAMSQTQECMDNMRIKNELTVNYGDNTIEDPDVFRYNDSLGM